MRVPSPYTTRRLSHMIVSFILGMIVGGIIFLLIHGQSMEELLRYNRVLESNLKSMHDDLITSKMREEELNYRNKQRLIVKHIDIEMMKTKSSELDEITETEIKDRLKEDLKFLLTMPLESVAETTSAIEHLVNGRKYILDQREFSIELETLIIYTTIKCKVKVKRVK